MLLSSTQPHGGRVRAKKQHEKEKLKLDDVVRISESRLLMEFIIIWKHFSRVLCKSRWINQMENERRRRWRVQSSIWNCFDIIEWICSPVRAPIALHFSSNYTLLSWLKLALFLLWNWTRSLICSVVGGEHTQGNGGWRERKSDLRLMLLTGRAGRQTPNAHSNRLTLQCSNNNNSEKSFN